MSRVSGLGSFAVGAILTFAIHSEPSGVSIHVIGVILMIVGAVAFGTGLYRERWRQRMVEESIETGTAPAGVDLSDDDLIVEPAPTHSNDEVVVHEHVVGPDPDYPPDHAAAARTREFVTRPVEPRTTSRP